MKLAPPINDEVEVSVFGHGFGESIVCHIGNGDWIVVDSCLDHDHGQPVALSYLRSLGVDVAEAVKLVVATHWHDDHIRGISPILATVPDARFAVTAAFGTKDFRVALAPWLSAVTAIDGKGLSELRRIQSLHRHPKLASENTILFERASFPDCRIIALAPSDIAVTSCIAQLANVPRCEFRTRLPSIEGNHASIVLSIQVSPRQLLLGGDLEVRSDRKFGWLAVVDSQRRFNRPGHHVFKVPHHGSANADHQEIWDHLLNPEPCAIVTPFVHGSVRLPGAHDCRRLSAATPNAYATGSAATSRFRHPNRAVEKTMHEASRTLEAVRPGSGRVRLRGMLSSPPNSWVVEMAGNAYALGSWPNSK